MGEPQWVQFSVQRPKRKRAELACETCHTKKIRCDLQARSTQGHNNCTNCVSSGKDCRPRPSKRDKARQVAADGLLNPLTPPGDIDSQNFDANAIQSQHVGSDLDIEIPPALTHLSSVNIYQTSLPIACVNPPATESPQQAFERASVVSNDTSQNWRASESGTNRYVVDPGFLQVYGPENADDARNQSILARKAPNFLDESQPDLQQSFAETYFEYCYTWCPVLDKSTLSADLARSPLLANALALVGTHIQPPMLPHAGPASYYDRARMRFYDDEEPDLITCLKALSLFYWWSPRPPSVVHRHSSWWWVSVVIKHCQQAGYHRESETDLAVPEVDLGLRRRIWWTAFARERLTAICQGKPCVIDPEDCNIPEPTLADFPDLEDKTKAEVFIYWVRLCAIIGRIAKYLSRSSNDASSSFPVHHGRELINWVRSLPPHLQLPINSNHTTNFNRDVHLLHLPYLTIIIVLYLKRTSSQSLPQALPPATLAATCLARILKDVLVRSGTRYLMGITCWYCGMAFIALLQASKTDHLKLGADADLDILTLAVKQLKSMWATANVFEQGFDRLRGKSRPTSTAAAGPEPADIIGDRVNDSHLSTKEVDMHDGIDWMDYFPFVTAQTSVVANQILAQQNANLFSFDNFGDTSLSHFQDLFEGLDSWTDPKLFV